MKSHLCWHVGTGGAPSSALRMREETAIPLFSGTSGVTLGSGCSSSALLQNFLRFLYLHTHAGMCRQQHSRVTSVLVSLPFPPSFHPWGWIPWPHCWGSAHWDVHVFIEKFNIILTNISKPLISGGHITSTATGPAAKTSARPHGSNSRWKHVGISKTHRKLLRIFKFK